MPFESNRKHRFSLCDHDHTCPYECELFRTISNYFDFGSNADRNSRLNVPYVFLFVSNGSGNSDLEQTFEFQKAFTEKFALKKPSEKFSVKMLCVNLLYQLSTTNNL